MPAKKDYDGKIVRRVVADDGIINTFDKHGRRCFDNTKRERVVLNADLRETCWDCYPGVLGWTMPSDLDPYMWVWVQFDNGERAKVRTTQIDYVEKQRATAVAERIIEAKRGTSADASPAQAYANKIARWKRDWAKHIDFERTIDRGRGGEEVFAFTFPSLRRLAELEDREAFPIKITHAIGFGDYGAIAVIGGLMQEGTGFPERAELLLTWRTDKAIELESIIVGELDARQRRITAAANSDWHESNVPELLTLFEDAMPTDDRLDRSNPPDGARTNNE